MYEPYLRHRGVRYLTKKPLTWSTAEDGKKNKEKTPEKAIPTSM